MNNKYLVRGMLALAAVAMMSSSAYAGGWRNINHKVKNISRCDGWSGVITGAADGVGEIFYSAGLAYQVIPDAPAGQYTLTNHGFYRSQNPEEASKVFFAGEAPKSLKLFINGTEADMKNLYDVDGRELSDFIDGDGNYIWGVVPNSLGEARTFFNEGKYENTVTVNHEGGDLVFGIRNYGNPATKGFDEWCTFADFKLVGPNGEVEIANPDFIYAGDDGWDCTNVAGANKGRGNHNGGVFSKTNASPYNFGQTLYNMPAGKYRFTVTAFNEHFLGSHNGYYIPMKGALKVFEGKSAKDMWDENYTEYPMGQVSGNDEEYSPKGWVKVEALEAYVYMNEGEKDCGWLEDDINPWLEDGVVNGKQTAIKNIFDVDLEVYPEANNFLDAAGDFVYYWADGNVAWWESGSEREAAAIFVAHPELYKNSVEMEFTGDDNTFTIGTRKDLNQNNYWQPSFDWTLEVWDENYEFDSVNSVAEATAAPVYYNLQGVRVANPEKGIYIVREGNKTSKKAF